MGVLQTIKKLKEDFEWYPTTREIIEAMYWDLLGDKVGEEKYRASGKRYTMLDIGAGNGKVFDTIKKIAQEQPLLGEYYYHDIKKESKSWRDENERYANRVFITKYMVIEKSQILVDMMPKETLVVGMDFEQNTLIDKQADVVFCNPPYSQYEQWATRIIREANAKYIYLVIPQRWGKHKGIAQALKDRKAKVKIIGNFDFLNAEDRKARAYVSLVKVELNYMKYDKSRYHRGDSKVAVDPFDLWFEQTFRIKAQEKEDDYFSSVGRAEKKEREFQKRVENELVSGRDLVSVLVQLYNQEMEKLIGNYMKLSELDEELFAELNIKLNEVKESFKLKIQGLKNLYWEEIFNNLTEITKRLTRSTRDKLKNKLMANASIDFNESNIRSVVIWVLKNANHYYEEQMLELYDTFTTEEGIRLYKSNQHFVKDTFRYNKRDKKLDKYALDYRVILHYYVDDWDKREGRVADKQYENIRDVSVIGRNLGFAVNDEEFQNSNKYNGKLQYGVKSNIFFAVANRILPKGTKTLDGKIKEVYVHTNKPNENGERVMEKDGVLYVYSDKNKTDWVQYKIGDAYFHENTILLESDIFTTVKPHKNGNCHFQFNKKFMQKLNLEVGRIRGWLKDPKHASEEMDISIEDATEYWKSSFTLLPENIQNLLPNMNINISAEDENEKNPVIDNSESEIKAKDDEVKKEEMETSNLYDENQLEVFKNGTLFDVA
ncbi:DUF4942 domain-containing protein [Sulfurimonas indica]|uniref:DUF4942 domain-containing protein n=1 Tax=Sulfurimonas indica TaxID=2508707 RepID=UPI0012650501|nr:DUF4942 domain-containing protein [Sulfurimonas indica]